MGIETARQHKRSVLEIVRGEMRSRAILSSSCLLRSFSLAY